MSHAFLKTANPDHVNQSSVGEVLTGDGGWYGRWFREPWKGDRVYGPFATPDAARCEVERHIGIRTEFAEATWQESASETPQGRPGS